MKLLRPTGMLDSYERWRWKPSVRTVYRVVEKDFFIHHYNAFQGGLFIHGCHQKSFLFRYVEGNSDTLMFYNKELDITALLVGK